MEAIGKIIRTRNHVAGVVACAVVALCAALIASPAQASASTKWTRLGGNTALDTMALVSRAGHTSASMAIIATSADYYDALTAASLAGHEDAPILLTDGHALSSQTRAELRRLGATNVIVVGGTSAVSDGVASSIKSLGCSVTRVWGRTAIDTANAIARQVRGRSDTCLVATSTGYWDALSASAYACANDAPIFLTGGGNTLSSSTLAEIRAGGYSKVVICGGTAAVSSSVESQLQGIGVSSDDIDRLGGPNAYDTSSLICDWEVSQGMSRDGMVVATGDGYWDALAGSALAGSKGSVIILVNDGDAHGAAKAQFVDHHADVSTGYVLGGTAAVSVPTWKYLNGHMRTTTIPAHDEQRLVTPAKYETQTVATFCPADQSNGEAICLIDKFYSLKLGDIIPTTKTFLYSGYGESWGGNLNSIRKTDAAATDWCYDTYGDEWSASYYFVYSNITSKHVKVSDAVYTTVHVDASSYQEWVSA